jgi:hypothetical protein
VSAGRPGPAGREPSWRTAVTEAQSARRHLSQAGEALARLSAEVDALREWGDATARLAVARRLCDGPDGGVLAALDGAGDAEGSDPSGGGGRAAALLERLAESLGLAPIAARGEVLSLSADELGELDVRGPAALGGPRDRGLFRVVRSGWWLGSLVVERPLVEAVGPDVPATGRGGSIG